MTNLPRVMAAQPVVGLFLLPAVLEGLFEHAVLVTQSITDRRQLHRRHRVEEASRQPPEPAITQAGVRFLFQQAEPIELLLLDGLLSDWIEHEVRDVVRKRPAD